MKAILSIKPEFVEKIFSGEKKYEYRKKVFKQDVDSVVIYSTKPVGMLVGEFKIDRVLHDDVENIWEKTNAFSGISYKYFKEYFSSQGMAYALKIKDLIIYEKPLCPKKIIPNFIAPQSFRYIK
ncbi:MAG: ASCH domain-containing protein [Anaeromicrobium sp.]|jgi:predicted transcriptional regulator|uniref:ASCH domain-containing protein n=1 Tax=Anaeromicrobium sp. TaxID=1929132 RepID=UPI0025D712D6|nr:ASCH domain-containing protein [Anaeromicrobium sp.]MCT4594625.1 ASCH domain-containing protein [Anaeromicrobium sp.]